MFSRRSGHPRESPQRRSRHRRSMSNPDARKRRFASRPVPGGHDYTRHDPYRREGARVFEQGRDSHGADTAGREADSMVPAPIERDGRREGGDVRFFPRARAPHGLKNMSRSGQSRTPTSAGRAAHGSLARKYRPKTRPCKLWIRRNMRLIALSFAALVAAGPRPTPE